MGEKLRFGRYKVSRTLGRGAMGVVYLAEDPLIGREVAIKVVDAGEGVEREERDQLEARFEREFQSAGMLSHPNIVSVYDVGHDEDGTAFIAMEYVPGESLQDILAENRAFTLAEIADLATQLSSGLDYAHEHGIVHRDVKPANILIGRDGRAKIADFGIARVATTTLTRTGSLVGTPAYMSPEQVTGNPVDGAADQFSLAVMLYQMLTGKRPFIGDSPTTMMWQIVHEDPPPPSKINAALPESVDNALGRSLAKMAEDRYPRCIDLANALRRALGASSEDATVVMSSTDAETVVTNRRGVTAQRERAAAERRDKAAALFAKAEELQDAGKLKESVRLGEQVLDVDPDHAPAKRLMALAEAELDASHKRERAIETLLASAIELEKGGRYRAAIEIIRKVFLLDPEEPTAKRLAATIERQNAARREAIESLPTIESLEEERSPDGVGGWLRAAAAQAPFAARGVAAVTVIVVAVLGWYTFVRLPTPPPATGRLLVNEVPWAYVTAVVDADGVSHLDAETATPVILSLPPGTYTVTLNDTDGTHLRDQTIEVSSEATSTLEPEKTVDVEEYFRQAGWR